MINEHDITKSMLNRMRTIIKENVETPEQMGTQQDQQTEELPEQIVFLSGGNPKPVKSGMETYWDDDKKKFLELVGPETNGVTFIDFAITPKTGTNEGDVLLSGKLDGYDADFTMNKDQTLGLRLTTNTTQLNDDFMKLLQTLKGYYGNWQKEWANKLNTENFD